MASVVALILALPQAAAALEDEPAEGPTSLVTIKGGGWGHGTGMSQYGTQGQALRGRNWPDILRTYFTGVGLGTLGSEIPDPGVIWVGIQQDQSELEIAVTATGTEEGFVTVVRQNGETEERVDILPGNSFTLAAVPQEEGGVACTVAVQDLAWEPGPCSIDISWDGWEPDPSVSLAIGDRSYKRGTLHIRPNKPAGELPDGFHAVVELPLESYLLGLAEVPYSWHPQALGAQAVAGRSYAANKMALRGHPANSPLRQDLCWCQLFDSTFDQFWIGTGSEDPAWTAAVTNTTGEVLTHPEVTSGGGPIAVPTFYSSSTFGHTEDSGVAFGSGYTPPYLVGVPDPWSIEPAVNNPYATWEKELDGDAVAASLGMDIITGASIRNCAELAGPAYSRSGAALEIEFTGLRDDASASTCEYTRVLRSKLGLRSMQVTQVRVDVINPPRPQGEPKPIRPADVGLQDPNTGIWVLRHADGGISTFYYGDPQDIPLACDWNGDAVATVGLYRARTGFLYLRNSNTFGVADIDIFYGIPEDLPVCGDWNGDGIETIGIYRPSQGKFYLRNSNTQGFADLEFFFGAGAGIPVAGDWNGDGTDSVGLYDPATKNLTYTNSNTAIADYQWKYANAAAADRIVVGDWNGDGIDSVGVYRPADRTFYLRDTLTQENANIVIELGPDERRNPIAGFWD